MSQSLRPSALTEGNLETDPFAHLLLAAFEQRFGGSLVIWSGEQPFASNADQVRILFEGGVPVAADLGQQPPGLFAGLIPLTMRRAGGYRFLPKVDVVGSAPRVLRGHVDPLMLLATALRSSYREDVIEDVVQGTNGRVLRLRTGCPFERFGLTRDEWTFLQELKRRPASVPGLMARADGSETFTKRMVYLLRVTGMVSVLPLGQRADSRAVSIPSPLTGEDDLTGSAVPEREHTDTVALLTYDEPFAQFDRPTNAQRRPDLRPPHVRVPSDPPAELSGDLSYRYRQIVRHHRLLRTRNLFELLGVGPEDDDQSIHDAYAVLEVQWRHEQLPPTLLMLRPLVDEILEGLAEARDTLTHPAKRYEYIERLRHGDARLMSLCRVEDGEDPRDTVPLRPRRVGNA